VQGHRVGKFERRQQVSLSIDTTKIARVRLQDGSEHDVVPGSFLVDGFDLEEGDETVFNGGGVAPAFSYGAQWMERDEGSDQERKCFCPIAAIIKLEYRKRAIKRPQPKR
jgi:hypothetical protein